MEEIVSAPALKREMPTAPDLMPLKGTGEKILTPPIASVERNGSAWEAKASGKLNRPVLLTNSPLLPRSVSWVV